MPVAPIVLPAHATSDEVWEWARLLSSGPRLRGSTINELLGMPYTTNDPTLSEAAMYVFHMAAVPPRRLHDVVLRLLDIIDDSDLPFDVRAQAAEAVGDLLAYTKLSSPRRVTTTCLVARLSDRAPEVRFWSAFSLGKLRARNARRALRALTGDETIVPGWWTVGQEASDALDWIEGRPSVAQLAEAGEAIGG